MPIQNIFILDGVEDEYQYSFEVISSESHVMVFIWNGTSETELIRNTDYTIDVDTKTVTLENPGDYVNGEYLIIRRHTTRDRQIEYHGGATITSDNLNEDFDRLTAVTQEIEANAGGIQEEGTAEATGITTIRGEFTTDQMPVIATSEVETTFPEGFVPDEFILIGSPFTPNLADVAYHAVFAFTGEHPAQLSETRHINPPALVMVGAAYESEPPAVRITRKPDGNVAFRIMDERDLTAWSNVRWIAKSYGNPV